MSSGLRSSIPNRPVRSTSSESVVALPGKTSFRERNRAAEPRPAPRKSAEASSEPLTNSDPIGGYGGVLCSEVEEHQATKNEVGESLAHRSRFHGRRRTRSGAARAEGTRSAPRANRKGPSATRV